MGQKEPTERFQIDGFQIDVPVAAISEPLRKRLESGQFEVAERALVKRFVQPGDRLLDLGAGAGLVSLTAARILGAGHITAVEANPQMHRALRDNFRCAGADEIRLIKGAVVGPDHPGKEALLNVNPGFWSASLHDNPRLRSMQTRVPAKRLPQLLRSTGANVVVMDVEGEERAILSRDLPPQIRLVIVELHPGHYGQDGSDQVMAVMRAQGFAAQLNDRNDNVVAFQRDRT